MLIICIRLQTGHACSVCLGCASLYVQHNHKITWCDQIRGQAHTFSALARGGGWATCARSNGFVHAGVNFAPYEKRPEGCETTFAVNHLAHFVLFEELKDLLIQSSEPNFESRVIMLTSDVHKLTTVRLNDLAFEKEEYNPVRCGWYHASMLRPTTL